MRSCIACDSERVGRVQVCPEAEKEESVCCRDIAKEEEMAGFPMMSPILSLISDFSC